LTEQNQQLRLEIERVVQSALQLRQVADAHHPRPATPTSESTRSELELHFVSAPAASPPARANEPTAPTEPIAPKPVVEQESQPQRTRSTERSPEVGGWWLVLIILLIVVTAFGTGFLIVRPLLPNR
jgi:cobalamin biosynthesis Mg chelatase CobN